MAAGTRLALVLAASLVAGCSAADTASPILPVAASPTVEPVPSGPVQRPARPTPTPTTATPTLTPAPMVPAGPLRRTAVVGQDGVRVTIELERNPMPAGEVTRVTTTVRNLGTRTLHWFSDGCSTPVGVGGELAVAWRPGVVQAGKWQEFKARALDLQYRTTPLAGPSIVFGPEDALGQGSYGCGDIGINHEIVVGSAIHETRAWDGMAWMRWGPFPTGRVTITGVFADFWRGRHQPEYPDIPRIEVALDAWVTDGADETWLSPPEVVDAALVDRDFIAYLETQDLGNGREEILWYRPDLGAWEVGVLIWYEFPEPRLHLVHVDPHTGAVLATVDRPWDEKRDGVP